MTVNMSTKSSGEAETSSPKPKGGEESEEESEVLEESPCGRWQKRREEVPVFILMYCVLYYRAFQY